MASRRKAKKSRPAGRKTARAAKRATKKAKPAAKKAPSRARKAAAKKTAARKKAPPREKKKTVGEGDYAASRAFLKDQAGFVRKNKARIPAMGRAAEMALDGAEGATLRAAEAAAGSRSRAGTGEATIEGAQAEALRRDAE